ncbi:hypothetical protein AND_009428 [Anopheles darlingi]|uniref:Uncharacterized protein n=1 Tax=Anopheles darlingi TaxID=43151 RepID=W5J894_ANODA|nr:hypothetical protein AND_009428 [Anopheles darlingi]
MDCPREFRFLWSAAREFSTINDTFTWLGKATSSSHTSFEGGPRRQGVQSLLSCSLEVAKVSLARSSGFTTSTPHRIFQGMLPASSSRENNSDVDVRFNRRHRGAVDGGTCG